MFPFWCLVLKKKNKKQLADPTDNAFLRINYKLKKKPLLFLLFLPDTKGLFSATRRIKHWPEPAWNEIVIVVIVLRVLKVFYVLSWCLILHFFSFKKMWKPSRGHSSRLRFVKQKDSGTSEYFAPGTRPRRGFFSRFVEIILIRKKKKM